MSGPTKADLEDRVADLEAGLAATGALTSPSERTSTSLTMEEDGSLSFSIVRDGRQVHIFSLGGEQDLTDDPAKGR